MINLEQRADGVVLPIRAQPGARRNGIVGVHDGALKVAVTQAAEKGKANKAIVEALCRALKIRRGQVELLSGTTSPQKRFLVREIKSTELQRRIAAALHDDR